MCTIFVGHGRRRGEEAACKREIYTKEKTIEKRELVSSLTSGWLVIQVHCAGKSNSTEYYYKVGSYLSLIVDNFFDNIGFVLEQQIFNGLGI